MAHIPQPELERIKSQISLERLTASMGVILTRHGADLIWLCPFHDDKEPSLQLVGYYYDETLKQSPEALAYLQKRGLDSSEAIDHFKLGFANRTLAY